MCLEMLEGFAQGIGLGCRPERGRQISLGIDRIEYNQTNIGRPSKDLDARQRVRPIVPQPIVVRRRLVGVGSTSALLRVFECIRHERTWIGSPRDP